jgi:hypothetical protein
MILDSLSLKYKSDKGVTPYKIGQYMHGYTDFYEKIFESRRNEPLNILELGGWGENSGGSIRIWQEYFPNANIFTFDLNDQIVSLSNDRVVAKQCDLDNEMSFIHNLVSLGKTFDIVIDDASHQPKHQVRSLLCLIPFLNPNFQYIIEDMNGNFDLLNSIKSQTIWPHLSPFEWLFLSNKIKKAEIISTKPCSILTYIR